mmetsp:Transcript_33011/g.105888  ORF Transcript_33011/g.105888 Transcript_33011/m.105888 type:complete len:553 (-) Transcript_33011:344-2002(-)
MCRTIRRQRGPLWWPKGKLRELHKPGSPQAPLTGGGPARAPPSPPGARRHPQGLYHLRDARAQRLLVEDRLTRARPDQRRQREVPGEEPLGGGRREVERAPAEEEREAEPVPVLLGALCAVEGRALGAMHQRDRLGECHHRLALLGLGVGPADGAAVRREPHPPGARPAVAVVELDQRAARLSRREVLERRLPRHHSKDRNRVEGARSPLRLAGAHCPLHLLEPLPRLGLRFAMPRITLAVPVDDGEPVRQVLRARQPLDPRPLAEGDLALLDVAAPSGHAVHEQVGEEEDLAPLPVREPHLGELALAHKGAPLPHEALLEHLRLREAPRDLAQLAERGRHARLLVDEGGHLADAGERLPQVRLVRVAWLGVRNQLLEQQPVARHALDGLDEEGAHVEPSRVGVRLAHLEVAVLVGRLARERGDVRLRLRVVGDVPRVAALDVLGRAREDRAKVAARLLLLEPLKKAGMQLQEDVQIEEDRVQVRVRKDGNLRSRVGDHTHRDHVNLIERLERGHIRPLRRQDLAQDPATSLLALRRGGLCRRHRKRRRSTK